MFLVGKKELLEKQNRKIEIKAAGAQLSPYSRSDDYHNNLYKWFPKNFPDYFTIYKEIITDRVKIVSIFKREF